MTHKMPPLALSSCSTSAPGHQGARSAFPLTPRPFSVAPPASRLRSQPERGPLAGINRQMDAGRAAALALILSAIGLLSGCRAPQEAPAATPPTAQQPADFALDYGVIRHVNREYGYAVVRCAVLPSVGQAVIITRDDHPVGRARIEGPGQPPFFTAAILEGEAWPGDRVIEEKP